MTNTCTITFSRGKNIGRKCCEVHKWCKHKQLTCPHCNKVFSYQHTYESHKCKNHSSTNMLPNPNITCDKIDDALITKLEDELEEIKISKISQNINICKGDIYTNIIEKMGENGNKFIMDEVISGNYDKLIDYIYVISNPPHPIACKPKYHFRYLDDDQNIIDDVGGHLFISKMSALIQNALLQANAHITNSYMNMESNNEDHIYNDYDMRQVQEKINKLSRPQELFKFRELLMNRFSDPNHPFFSRT